MPPAVVRALTASGTEPRQCWECLRRRWVCDAARPVCNKCRNAGIVCPGYSDTKPLTWLAPGRVTSRARKQRKTLGSKRAKRSKQTGIKGKGECSARSSTPELIAEKVEDGETVKKEEDDAANAHGSEASATSANTSLKSSGGNSIHVGDRYSDFITDAHSPKTMTEPRDLDEAVGYYNTYIYPSLNSNQLEANPFVIPVTGLSGAAESLQHALISMTLSHRLMQIPEHQRGCYPWKEITKPFVDRTVSIGSTSGLSIMEDAGVPLSNTAKSSSINSGSTLLIAEHGHNDIGIRKSMIDRDHEKPVSELLWRLQHHTGEAIRHLTEEIGIESTRSSDATITSVVVLLIAEVQQNISPHWRPHANGLETLIMLRGGLGKLMRSAVHMKPLLLSFIIFAAIANTTSPPSKESTAALHVEMIDEVSELYTVGVFPTLPCPLPLFLDILHINNLRMRAGCQLTRMKHNTPSALTILEHIHLFDVSNWVETASNVDRFKEWSLIAKIFQSSISLYAISALPDVLPPLSLYVQQVRQHHRDCLFVLLEAAMQSPIVRKGMLWPLIVAGVEAAERSHDEKMFLGIQLGEMSRETGAPYPLVARKCLEEFWESGNTGWDKCFYKPYAILT